MPVSVAEHASISLNMPKCPCKWLNKLFGLFQGSEYACLSYMLDRLLKMSPFLRAEFWIWNSCIYKVYPELRICLIIAPYTSITTEYTQICINAPQYSWTWLNIPKCVPKSTNIPEYAWINKLFSLFHGSEYAAVLNMPRCSYNNIITFVTKVIRLEFLYSTISSFLTQVNNNNNKS